MSLDIPMSSGLAAAFEAMGDRDREEQSKEIEKLKRKFKKVEKENKLLKGKIKEFEKIEIENKFLNKRIIELEEEIEEYWLGEAGESR